MIRNAEPRDWPAVLALNAGSVEMLSPMDEARLAKLAAAACYFRVDAGEMTAPAASFSLGFRKGAAYDGEVFAVFERDNRDFLYIDRVVEDETRCGQGGSVGFMTISQGLRGVWASGGWSARPI
jgi:uncharacterized protein